MGECGRDLGSVAGAGPSEGSCLVLLDVGADRYRGCMDGVTTYEQLQAMTPEQRRAHFNASIVLDPTTLRPGMQRRLEEMAAELDERQRVREERLRGQAS